MLTTFPEATHTHAILSALSAGSPGRGAILNCRSLHSFLAWASHVHAAHCARRVGAPAPGSGHRPIGPSRTLGASGTSNYEDTPEECRLPENVSPEDLRDARVSWIAFRNKDSLDVGYQFIGEALARGLAKITGRKVVLVAVGGLPLMCEALEETISFRETSNAVTIKGWQFTGEGPAQGDPVAAVVMPGLLDLPTGYKYFPTTQTVVLA